MIAQQLLGFAVVMIICIGLSFLALRAIWEIAKVVATLFGTVPPSNSTPGVTAAIKKHGEPTVEIDQRVYDSSGGDVLLMTQAFDAWQPQIGRIVGGRQAFYAQSMPNMPYRLPSSPLAADIELNVGATVRTQEGFFTVERPVEPRPTDNTAYVDDVGLLTRPIGPVDGAIRQVLTRSIEYNVEPPKASPPIAAPNHGKVPSGYPIPRPTIRFPNGKRLADLNAKELVAFKPYVSRFDDADGAWEDADAAHRAALLKLRDALVRLQDRLRQANARQDELYRQMHTDWASGKSAWERHRDVEREHLQALLDGWQTAYLENPERLAVLTLDYLPKPPWLPTSSEAKYDTESRVLIVETEFPDVGRITWFRRGTVPAKAATKSDAKAASEAIYQALALRYAWEIARSANDNLVDTVVVNGWADYIDRTTGETKRAFVSSLLSRVNYMRGINLPMVDVHQAFAALKGVAGRAQTVTPVAPVVRMNTNDRRFVDGKAVLDDVGDQNLATMDWGDFEHLCRELFEKVFAGVGAEVKVTQASRDQGVDAVIFDPDPIRGGKIVIQAKRYSGTVDVSAVRDLWGTTQHEGAMKGILVTTSGFGPDAYNFIAGKPLTLINGGELLGILSQQGYNFRIDLAEAKKMAREQAYRHDA